MLDITDNQESSDNKTLTLTTLTKVQLATHNFFQ